MSNGQLAMTCNRMEWQAQHEKYTHLFEALPTVPGNSIVFNFVLLHTVILHFVFQTVFE